MAPKVRGNETVTPTPDGMVAPPWIRYQLEATGATAVKVVLRQTVVSPDGMIKVGCGSTVITIVSLTGQAPDNSKMIVSFEATRGIPVTIDVLLTEEFEALKALPILEIRVQ